MKGSRLIIEELQALIAEYELKDIIELSGTFCMNNCTKGVCLTVDEKPYSLQPENTKEFFVNEVLTKL